MEDIGIKIGIVIMGFLFLSIAFGLSVFRINTGQGAIITHLNGKKDATTQEGWHFVIPLFENYVKYPIVNDYEYFPSEQTLQGAGGENVGVSGVEINAKDDTVVDVSAITFFDRTDLFQWGVKNVDPDTQFDRALSGIIRDVIQQSETIDILHNREKIGKIIFDKMKSSEIEKQFGVKITKFQLQHTSYIDEVVKANAHKQALNLEAEGRLDASRKDAESIKIRADAEKYKADLMNEYSSSVLQYMATIEEYNTMKSRTGDVVWVIPTGLQPSFIPTSTSGAT